MKEPSGFSKSVVGDSQGMVEIDTPPKGGKEKQESIKEPLQLVANILVHGIQVIHLL